MMLWTMLSLLFFIAGGFLIGADCLSLQKAEFKYTKDNYPKLPNEVVRSVKIINAPERLSVSLGERAELKCHSSGTPPPSMQWYKNGVVLEEWIDKSNSDPIRFGNTHLNLVIDCVTVDHAGNYTCVAFNSKSAKSSTSTLTIQDDGSQSKPYNCSERASDPVRPRIINWRENSLETEGSDVLLPCGVIGNPPPVVFWVDIHRKPIFRSPFADNNRFQVMESGELLIMNLKWEDMGSWTCMAATENCMVWDNKTTFLYPMQKMKMA